MVELTVKAAMDSGFMTRDAAAFSARMSAFDARVLLRSRNITVNAKSIMGIVSLSVEGGMPVTVIAEGPDEGAAAAEAARLLGA